MEQLWIQNKLRRKKAANLGRLWNLFARLSAFISKNNMHMKILKYKKGYIYYENGKDYCGRA